MYVNSGNRIENSFYLFDMLACVCVCVYEYVVIQYSFLFRKAYTHILYRRPPIYINNMTMLCSTHNATASGCRN